jgi:hypothetical protein
MYLFNFDQALRCSRLGPLAFGRRDERAARQDLELLRDRMRQDVLALAGLLDNVAEPCDVRCSANGLDVMLHWNAERQRIPIG